MHNYDYHILASHLLGGGDGNLLFLLMTLFDCFIFVLFVVPICWNSFMIK